MVNVPGPPLEPPKHWFDEPEPVLLTCDGCGRELGDRDWVYITDYRVCCRKCFTATLPKLSDDEFAETIWGDYCTVKKGEDAKREMS